MRRLTAGALVAAVGAVLVPIALPDGRDAAAVPTLELVGLTFRLRTCRGGHRSTHYSPSTPFNARM